MGRPPGRALAASPSPETEAPLHAFLSPETIRTIYLHGARRPDLIAPDNWVSDAAFMQGPHAVRINLDLFDDYRSNVPLYPAWQRFLREQQPKTIIFWGQQDLFFTPAGGDAYLADLPDAEMHRLDAGHFAVEDHLDYIADRMRQFYERQVASPASGQPAFRASTWRPLSLAARFGVCPRSEWIRNPPPGSAIWRRSRLPGMRRLPDCMPCCSA